MIYTTIQACFKYRYKKSPTTYMYIITVFGGQELELSEKELKAQILAGNIEVKGLHLVENKLILDDVDYYINNATADNVEAVYVSELIEGLVLGEDVQLSTNLKIPAGKLLDIDTIATIKEFKHPADKINIRDNLGVRNYIAKDSILCKNLSCFYTYLSTKLLKQQQYTQEGYKHIKQLHKYYLTDEYFDRDKNLLFQLYLLYNYHTYTFEHCCTVAIYSALIGMKLGLDQEYIDDLFLGGLLHDIGKRKVPVALLDKNGKLTDEEFEIVMSHAYLGYTIVANLLGFDSPIFHAYSDVERMQRLTQAVMGHHSKLDGTGYPKGYKNEYLTTQIVTVADIFDALTSSRAYKVPYSNKEAIKILKKDAKAGQLNANVVDALTAIMDAKYKKPSKGYIMYKNNKQKQYDAVIEDLYAIS